MNEGPWVSRAVRWWFGDAGRQVCVWLVWAGMTVAAAGYILEYGTNMPVHDEWLFVPVLFDSAAAKCEWVFERHGEHRYPLARGVFLALFTASGHDFRAGMWAVLALQAATAAVFVLSARRVRGATIYSDAWYPLLLLHRGHAENLVMGYQVAFLLNVLAVAGFVALVVKCGDRPSHRVGLLGVGLLIPLAVGGGIGLLFVPFLAGWLLWRMTAGRREPFNRISVATSVAVLTVLAFAAWGVLDAASARSDHTREPVSEWAWTAVQTVGNSVGSCLTGPRSLIGVLLSVVAVGAVVRLVRVAVTDPSARGRVLGCLAVTGGVAAFVAVVAVTRQNVASPRYTVIVVLAPCAMAVALADRLPRSVGWTVISTLFVIIGGGVIVRENWLDGMAYGRNHRDGAAAVRADVVAGVPIDLLAERHRYYSDPAVPAYWNILWRNGASVAAGARPPSHTETISSSPPVPELSTDPWVLRYRLGDSVNRFVSAVRVRYTVSVNRPWQGVRFRWTVEDPDGQIRTIESRYNPWLLAGNGTLLVWVNGRMRDCWVEVANDDPPLRPYATEWVDVGTHTAVPSR